MLGTWTGGPAKPDDGGSAFPFDVNMETTGTFSKGMTLRDYFAAKAMQGLCHSGNFPTTAIVAELAYEVADAMLEARKGDKA